MTKKNKNIWIIAIIIIIAFFIFKGQDELSFYKHRECFVSEKLMGCEAEGGAKTIDFDQISCTSFMDSRGCQPENCYYYGDAVCGIGYSIKDMVDNSCETDKDCLNKFQNTGYVCSKNADYESYCKFEGNHREDSFAERTDILAFGNFNEWYEKNSTIFMILGAIVMIWFLIFIFSEEHPGHILK